MGDAVFIDGSTGEGGGQILRTALTLSTIGGRPFRMERIRANRKRSGLMQRHLTAVRAAATICSARTEGAEIGSRSLTFSPGKPGRGGSTAFRCGPQGAHASCCRPCYPL